MPEEEKTQGPDIAKGEDVSLKELAEITAMCADVPGYVLFVAKIAKNPDAKGNLVIDYHYRRYHFSYEDTRGAVNKFKEELVGDFSGGIHD